jgi:hypothetical protein
MAATDVCPADTDSSRGFGRVACQEESYQEAEAKAEATTEQAHQLAQATEDVLEELQDGQASHAG